MDATTYTEKKLRGGLNLQCGADPNKRSFSVLAKKKKNLGLSHVKIERLDSQEVQLQVLLL